MKRIGLIGGFSWHSTLEYYRYLNRFSVEINGPDHGANLVLVNLNSATYRDHLQNNDENSVLALLADGIQDLRNARADFYLFCANGLHRFLPRINSPIPNIHIADCTAHEVKRKNIKRVGLLGVYPTMTSPFYPERLQELGIETIIPDESDMREIDRIIFAELVHGQFKQESKKKYLQIMDRLKAKGAQGIILGCTEIPILIQPEDFDLPTFSTTEIHCRAAIEKAKL